MTEFFLLTLPFADPALSFKMRKSILSDRFTASKSKPGRKPSPGNMSACFEIKRHRPDIYYLLIQGADKKTIGNMIKDCRTTKKKSVR